MVKKSGSGSGMKNPDHTGTCDCLETVFWVKISAWDVYPEHRIRLSSIAEPGSRIRIKVFTYFKPKNRF
jgi:hypothetical protein